MKWLSFLLGLVLFASGCAGVDADLEKSRYLLGKGGRTNALEALTILTPLVQPGALSGSPKFEAIRLYVGANVQAAGFDTIDVLSSLIYAEEGEVLATLRSAGEGIIDNADAKAYLATAEAILTSNESTFSTLDARTRNGLYFQWALVEFFDGLRVFLKVSGLSTTSASFDVTQCQTNFNAAGTGDTFSNGIDFFEESRAHMVGTTSAASLSASNSIVEKLDELISNLQARESDVALICQYLREQSN